jgi:hypothetical protein
MHSASLTQVSTGNDAQWPSDGPFNLDDDSAYARWREAKLAHYPKSARELVVGFADMAAPTASELAAVRAMCGRANMAVYHGGVLGRDALAVRPALRALGAVLGLRAVEDHRSAEADGIVAIEVAAGGGRLGYIPYTTRPISWHTDGYYNYHGASNCVQAMLLHCARDAAEGGVNALLDHEIAYIRLRDRDPALIRALMHPQTMTIPEGEEAGGRTRPDNTGPVFFVNPASGALVMRYTARKRYIAWRDDADTHRAVAAMEEIFDNDPLTIVHKLAPGQGLICNNVLHTRSGFADGDGAGRLLYRVRYHDRIEVLGGT